MEAQIPISKSLRIMEDRREVNVPDKQVGKTEMLICVVLCVVSSPFMYLDPLFTTITLHDQVGRGGKINRKE